MRETADRKTLKKDPPGNKGEIKGTTQAEIKVKEKTQLARQAGLVKRFKERDDLDSVRELAEYDTTQARRFINSCKSILKNNLGPGSKTDWASLYDDRPYPPFVFKGPVPRYKKIAKEADVPQKSFFSELFSPSAKKRRIHLENEAKKELGVQMQEYEKKRELERTAHEIERSAYIAEQEAYNSSVEQFQLDFEKGCPGAVESFARIALAQLVYPDLMELDFDAWYNPDEKLILIEGVLPGPLEIPRTILHQYDEEQHGINAIDMDQTEFAHFYESILLQITLSAIRVIFESTPERHIRRVAYNGYIRGIAPETGEESRSCILTCKVSRDVFAAIDLAANSPGETYAAIKGSMKEPLIEINPVQPLVNKRPVDHGQTHDRQDAAPKQEVYRPGDLSHVAQELMSEMLEQIENNLIETGEDDEKKMLH